MKRTVSTLVVVLVVVASLAAVPTGAIAQSTETATDTPTPTETAEETEDETSENETVDEPDENAPPPGELLGGTIGVQEAEIDGEIRNRAFGIRVAQAASDDAKADVVSGELDSIEERLTELEERKQELREKRENGTISESRYRTEMATLAAETNSTTSLINSTANASAGLPAEMLEEKGVNATAIATLSTKADGLTGPEVSEIARRIAGPSVGQNAASSVNADADGDAENRTGADGDAENRTGADGDAENRTGADSSDRPGPDGADNGTDGGGDERAPDGTGDDTDVDEADGSGASGGSASDRGQ